MAQERNKFQEFIAKRKEEGKVYYFDTPEDIEKQERMDKDLMIFKRELILKQARSEISASKIILTA